MSTSIEGVRFSDQLGALLAHAHAHGFRIEPDTRGKRGGGGTTLVCYPPDKDQPPITVNERGAKFNKPHYENIRRDFYRAGLPPLPGDTKPVPADVPAPDETDGVTVLHVHNTSDLDRVLADPDKRTDAVAGMTAALFARSPVLEPVAELAGGIVNEIATWGAVMMEAVVTESLAAARAELSREVEEALRMASDWEATATRTQNALDKAVEREDRARSDCKDALRRAEAAEAKVAELEAVLTPLRALLAN